MELVLACDFRIAADDPEIELGFPEVLPGLIPDFGGSQRLSRLEGIWSALDLILRGKRIDLRKAAKIGLVDRSRRPGSSLRRRSGSPARAVASMGSRPGIVQTRRHGGH